MVWILGFKIVLLSCLKAGWVVCCIPAVNGEARKRKKVRLARESYERLMSFLR